MSKPAPDQTTKRFTVRDTYPEGDGELSGLSVEVTEGADGDLDSVNIEGFIFEGDELDGFGEVFAPIVKAWRKGKRKPKS